MSRSLLRLGAMLRVRLLGGLEVDAGVAGADVPAGRPARLVLGWLAAFPGEHARAEVAARLWPDVLDSSARASLRTALSELRAALGPAAMHLRATRETVELGGDGPVGRPARVLGAGRARVGCEDALALCRGEVLEGLDEEWVFELRSRHAAERAEAAVALVRAAREAGDAGSALAWARRLAAWDPLDEAAERELMLALAAAGDRAGRAALLRRLLAAAGARAERRAFGADARAGVAATARGARHGCGGRVRPAVARAPRCGSGWRLRGAAGGGRSPARGVRARAERRALRRVGDR